MKKHLKMFRKEKHTETKRSKTETQDTSLSQQADDSDNAVSSDAASTSSVGSDGTGNVETSSRAGTSSRASSSRNVAVEAEEVDLPYLYDKGGYVSFGDVASDLDEPEQGAGSDLTQQDSTPIYEHLDFSHEESSESRGSSSEQDQDDTIDNAPEVPKKSPGLKPLSVGSDGYLKPVGGKKDLGTRVRDFFASCAQALISVFTGNKNSPAKRNLFDDLIAVSPQSKSGRGIDDISVASDASIPAQEPSSPTHSSDDSSSMELGQSARTFRNPAQGAVSSAAGPSGVRTARRLDFPEEYMATTTAQIHRDGEPHGGTPESDYRHGASSSSSEGSLSRAIFGAIDALSTGNRPSFLYPVRPSVPTEPNSTSPFLSYEEQRAAYGQNITPEMGSQQRSPSGAQSAAINRYTDISEAASTDHSTHMHNLGNSMNDQAITTSSSKGKEEPAVRASTSQTRTPPRVGKLSAQLLETIGMGLSMSHASSVDGSQKGIASTAQHSSGVIGALQKIKGLGRSSDTQSTNGVSAASIELASEARPSTGKKDATKSAAAESTKVVGVLQRLLGRYPNAKGLKVTIPVNRAATPSPEIRAPSLADLLEGRRSLRSVSGSSSGSVYQQEEPIYARSTKSSASSSVSSVSSHSDSEDVSPDLPARPFFDAQQTLKKEEKAARVRRTGSSLSERTVFLDVSTQKIQEPKPKAASLSSLSKAAALVRSISPVRLLATEKKAIAVKPLEAPKRVSVDAATVTPAQRAMHAFSSFASTAVETKPARPATPRPTVIARSPALRGLNLSGIAGQLSTPLPFPVKTVASARGSRASTSMTARVAEAHIVDSAANGAEMPYRSFEPVSSSASSAKPAVSPTVGAKPKKASKGLFPESSSAKITKAPKPAVAAKPSELARSPSPASPTKFTTEVSPQSNSAPRAPSASRSSSTVSVREQVLNWPPVSAGTAGKGKEMHSPAEVKRSARVVRSTSPRIRHSIDMLLNGAEKSSATVSSPNSSVNSGGAPKMLVTDFAQNKPSTSAENTPAAVNFTAIRMVKNSMRANGGRDTSAVSRRSVDLAVESIESRLKAERAGTSSTGNVRHSTGSGSINSPMQRNSLQRHDGVSRVHVDALVRKFSSPRGAKVDELVQKFEGKHSAAVASETSKQQRSR